MRPKKIRWIFCEPGERCYKPLCKNENDLEFVILSLDEYETIRLADFVKLYQTDAAKRMKISRSTFSRILDSAHYKIADALINIKAIKIKGGSCKVIGVIKNEREI